ncbi:hypothetical protein [Sphingomonas colocasiae]|uniref:Uncharacterized protein n=1 Tax=Sphingomonas colocasiae TaxID=1848973 RepID=A0ABS7PMJ6_9SPHN|nr:hypothetical protein [Sphingomonas colocasiae]MBY8822532.1 hypothetical protein [Sphingomonas colocasiae]
MAILPGVAHAGADKRLAAMTPERFRVAASTIDDPLEFETIISTERGHRREKAMKGLIGNDAYLRAVIDKRSGATRYEIWQEIRYFGPRRAYQSVHFEAGENVERRPLSVARHGADLCPEPETNGDCVMTKTMAFPIEETVLRSVAARYRSGTADGWKFKFKDGTGRDMVSSIAPAEAAGLLLAVDDYRTPAVPRREPGARDQAG